MTARAGVWGEGGHHPKGGDNALASPYSRPPSGEQLSRPTLGASPL